MAALTVGASLDVTVSATVSSGKGNRSISITTSVRSGGAPVAGASVSVVVTNPSGAKTTLSGTTGANGTLTVKSSLKPKDPTGTYTIQTTATKSGVGATCATSLNVQ
jgi:uncharacterized protein YfaS (alpha-2-macroglobulin family)